MELDITSGKCPCCQGDGEALSQSKTRALMIRLRKAAGLSQSDVARKMDVDRSTICRLESGAQSWTRAWVHRWLKATAMEAQAA